MLLISLLLTLACQKETAESTTKAIDKARQVAGQATSMGEETYPLEGRIVSRDPDGGTVTVDHREIPGVMAAMTMPYQINPSDLASLPPDGTQITATMHVKGDQYWITNVRIR